MTIGGVILGAIASTELMGTVVLALAIFCIILGIIILLWAFCMKDEPDEIERKKLELEKERLEFDKIVFNYGIKKENETRLEERVRELFVYWYNYIKYEYPAEIEGTYSNWHSFSDLMTLGDRLHACYQGQLMSASNPEDVKLDNDLTNLHNKIVQIAGEEAASKDRYDKDYRLPIEFSILQREILSKLWKKIKNPQSEYGEE